MLHAPLQRETWEWDGKTWRHRAGKIDPFRAWHAVAYDSKRERIVLFSGVYAVEYDDTWEYYATHRGTAVGKVTAYAESGATWWLESAWLRVLEPPPDLERLRRRIRAGPPRE